MFPVYKLLLKTKASTLPPKECFHLLFEVLTPMQAKGLWDFVNESKEASGNSHVDRVLSLFRESTLSISVKLLIVAGD